jgi:hypothetical protein
MDKSIMDLLSQHSNIIVAIMVFNVIVSGLQKILEIVKDKTATQVDNKLYVAVSKLSSMLSGAADFITGNREHK